MKYSGLEVRYWIRTTLQSFKMLFTGKIGLDSLSGPVGVVNVIGDAYEESKSEGSLITWMTMLNLLIFISANLGVMNLLPPSCSGWRKTGLFVDRSSERKAGQQRSRGDGTLCRPAVTDGSFTICYFPGYQKFILMIDIF